MAKVVFKNGLVENLEVFLYQGACLKGEATAYTFDPVTNETWWLKPVKFGDETIWLEEKDEIGMFLFTHFPEEMVGSDPETVVLRLLDRLYRLEN